MKKFAILFVLQSLLAATSLWAADPAEIAQLRAQLTEQRTQLETLRATLDAQQKRLDEMLNPGRAPAPAERADALPEAPLSLRIGNSSLTPVGFMDLTYVGRTTTGGSGIGTNFGSIPFNNNPVSGRLGENRLSAQNSRAGFRFDSTYKSTNLTGYFEGDFLGNNSANVAVTSNSDTFRLRLYWLRATRDKWEVLAGQSWSLLTPGRKGISPLPDDLFYSQDVDVNYQAGLVWSRDPGLRVVYRPAKAWSIALAAENAEQYVGGSSGSTAAVPPSLLANEFAQFNNAGNTLATSNTSPDFIAKVAYDPSAKLHLEVAGVESTFKGFNAISNRHFTKAGGGGSLNANFQIWRGLRLLTNNYWSDGGGRYIFGLAPDLTLKGDGDIALIHAGSTVTGPELTLGKTLLYGYYGGVYVGRYAVTDPATGKAVGYGYTGSSNGQNRSIQEATFGFKRTLWKDERYGALNLMGQYSWLSRSPWYVPAGQPVNAHQSQVYVNLRYMLPGKVPDAK